MCQNIYYTIFILSLFTVYSYGAHISEYNERELLLSMDSQLSELKEKLTSEVAKDSDIQFIRAEIQRQTKCELVKEADNEPSRADVQVLRTDIQSLRAELDNLKIEKDSAIQSLRAENQVLGADFQSLRAELEQQKKCILDKEADNQILRAELERQGKLKDEVFKKSNQLNSTSSLRNCVGAKSNGIHDIVVPKFSNQPFKVACDAQTREGGWTIILRRLDGSVNFYRNWTEYKNGFGNLDGEFFLGLDKIHAMTEDSTQELLVLLEDFEGDERFETYDEFAIGDESQQYELHTLGKASGTAGDSLSFHRGVKFFTYNKYNENWEGNCAIDSTGGWWYNRYPCQFSQLTGTYKDNGYKTGVNWYDFRGDRYSLKTAIMMIRPIKSVPY